MVLVGLIGAILFGTLGELYHQVSGDYDRERREEGTVVRVSATTWND